MFVAVMSFTQSPVQWQYSIKKLGDKTYELHLTATIEDGWHLYSQSQPEAAIAVPTLITFAANPIIVFNGKVKEFGRLERYTDKTIDITQNQYRDKVDFVQSIQLKAKAKTKIAGSITYQVCTDERCLPPATGNFTLAIE